MDVRRIKRIFFLSLLFIFTPSFLGVYGATLSKPANNLGLVGYWSFNDATSTQATDFSGRGNTGTLTNMSVPASATSGWGSGKLSGGLNFDGNNDYVEVASNSAFGITGDITISAWIKRNASNDYGGILSKGNGADRWDYEFYICGNSLCGANPDGTIGLYSDSPAGNITSSSVITDSNWHHVVVTRSGTTVTFYIDGVSAGGGTWSGAFNNNSDPIRIGTDGPGWSTSSMFNGSIDEVRLYSRSLTATEIRNLYNSGSIRINSSQNNLVKNGLVGHWSFDSSNLTDKVYDISGNGNNGYLYNVATGSAKTIGKIGQALKFDGVNDSVNIGDVNALDGISKMTVSAWVNQDSLVQGNSVVSKYSSSEEGWGILVSDQTAGGDDIMIRLSFSIIANIESVHTAGVWEHWTFVFDGTQTGNSNRLKFYKNGSQIAITTFGGTIPSTIPNTSATLCISGVESNSGNGCTNNRFFNGKIDEVRIYDRDLSASEIKTLYNAGESKINASQNVVSGSTLNSGLVGMWSFNSKDLSDKVYDRSGNGNDGYVNGRATSTLKTIGKVGQALDFDGTADYVYLGTPASLFPTSEITMSAWIKPDQLAVSSQVVSNDDGLTISNQMRTQGTGLRCSINSTNSTQGSTLVVDEWAHIACVYNGANIINYINGVNVGSTPLTGSISYPNSNTEPWRIGRRGDAAPGYFNGKIDEVRIYNRGLNASEIKQLYLSGR